MDFIRHPTLPRRNGGTFLHYMSGDEMPTCYSVVDVVPVPAHTLSAVSGTGIPSALAAGMAASTFSGNRDRRSHLVVPDLADRPHGTGERSNRHGKRTGNHCEKKHLFHNRKH